MRLLTVQVSIDTGARQAASGAAVREKNEGLVVIIVPHGRFKGSACLRQGQIQLTYGV
jgi:hypothetical protein